MSDWLASLPAPSSNDLTEGSKALSEDASADVETGNAGVKAGSPLGLEFIMDMGFDADLASIALERSDGDKDRALQFLQDGWQEAAVRTEVGDDRTTKRVQKRPRCSSGPAQREELEVEGFRCVSLGNSLQLSLQRSDLHGPTVGRFRPDGSLKFYGVDEWASELYTALPLRTGLVASNFSVAGASEAVAAGMPWTWHAFATAHEIANTHAELEALRLSGQLSSASAATTADVKARRDHVVFLDLHGAHPRCPPGCLALFRRMESAAAALQWPDSEQLLCPRLGMAALYDGHGAYYKPHRDNEQASTNHIKSACTRWLNYRALTAIAYVNPAGFEDPSDGGQLRCFLGADAGDQTGSTASHVQELLPRGGVAVFFPSRTLLHEVLPSYAPRYALTLWLVAAPVLQKQPGTRGPTP